MVQAAVLADDDLAAELNDRPRKRLAFKKPIELIGDLLLRRPPESADPFRGERLFERDALRTGPRPLSAPISDATYSQTHLRTGLGVHPQGPGGVLAMCGSPGATVIW